MQTWTLKEIDLELNTVKGTAFRAFKRLQDELIEDQDFIYLNASRHTATINALKAQGRHYDASIHALLFYPKAHEAIVNYILEHFA